MDDDVIENFVDESYESEIPIETPGLARLGFLTTRGCESLLTSFSRRRRRRRAIPNVEAAAQRSERSAGRTIRSELTTTTSSHWMSVAWRTDQLTNTSRAIIRNTSSGRR
jgi:hypothetical protein